MTELKLTALLILFGLLVVAGVLAALVWNLRVRPYVDSRQRRSGRRGPDASAGLAGFLALLELPKAGRRVPWFIKAFAVLVFLASADLVLILLLLLFGVR